MLIVDKKRQNIYVLLQYVYENCVASHADVVLHSYIKGFRSVPNVAMWGDN
jgi:hypothetical protein